MSSKFYVGVTDSKWFHYLASRRPDEVNFWKPGGGTFRALPEAGLFLFKLKRPHNAIGGGAFFLKFTRLPVTMAWDIFGDKVPPRNSWVISPEFDPKQRLSANRLLN